MLCCKIIAVSSSEGCHDKMIEPREDFLHKLKNISQPEQ